MCDGALPEIGDFAALTDAELVAAAARWARAESAAAARKMAAVAELYRRRTALADLDGRDRWVVDREASTISEIAAAQNITESRAMAQLLRGVALAERLPRVAALFAEGRITESLARVVVARTALITDVELMAAVDAELAAQITDWGTLSEKKIKEAIDAIVERHDPGAVRRVKDADKDRGVQFGFDSDAAGYTTLWARMYAPDADAFKQRVFDMAHRLCPDDPRSGEERLNDAFAAVGAGRVLRCECGNANCPGATGDTPAKDVVVHVVATRETLDQARAEADAAKTPQPTESKADEKPTPRKSACAAPPYVFGAGIATTALLAAFLDRATIRTVTHPGDAPPEPQYRPSAALSEFIRCRDLTCRFPYCDVPATRCDIDHAVPWPAGPTAAANLRCLCRKHHLLKTFWIGKTGWRDEQFADGTIVWTAPNGHTHTTYPGSAVLFPTLCEPAAPAPVQENREPTRTRGLNMPKRRRTRTQDRARYIEQQRGRVAEERNRPPPS